MATVVIMPGGFHPFHAGHLALYQSAQRAFPDAEVYVAATNDTSTRPFPFPVKEKLARLAGVEPGHFVQVKSPFRAEEITSKFDPNKDVLIFVRSEKDADKPPQAGGVKKDGSASYLQPLLGAKKLEPFARHAYMAYLPTVEFGPGMTSATEIRAAWPGLNDRRKTALVMSLYPRTQNNAKLAATVVGLLDAAIGTEPVAEGLNEFAVDGFGDSGDNRSKLLASVGRLLDGGNKVDWQVPGQMGHVTRVQNDGITMKRWKMPRSRMSFFLPMSDDSRDSRYTIKMVAPKHYAVVSAEPGVTESSLEDRLKKYVRPVVKTTPKIERTTNPAGRTTDHVEWKVTGPLGDVSRFTSKKAAQAHYDSFGQPDVAETVSASFNTANTAGAGAGMTASYQRRDNQPIDEDYLSERRL